MTDISEVILLKHEREITHLHDPCTIWMHDLLDVCNKLSRLFQVVEHRDGSDDLGLTAAQIWVCKKAICLEEADEHFIRHLSRKNGQILGRVKTNLVNVWNVVRSQQRSVVTPNI